MNCWFCVRLFRLAALAVPGILFANPQQSSSDLQTYLQVLPDGASELRVTNLRSASLVALSWEYRCGEQHGRSGIADAARTFAVPWEAGKTIQIPSADSGCSGGVNAAIWSDGFERGDAATLRTIRSCRTVARSIVTEMLDSDIRSTPGASWDPTRVIAELVAKRTEVPFAISVDKPQLGRSQDQGCAVTTFEYLISNLEDYQSQEAVESDKDSALAIRFVQWLEHWQAALGSRTYPSRPFWWRRP
jgi:hypothetical protein